MVLEQQERATSVVEGPLSLRVLGPVALFDEHGVVVALPPQKRELLAMLAAAAGRQVSRSSMCDALWGEDTPKHRHRLKSQVAQLRNLLPSTLGIDFVNEGYRLAGCEASVDSTRFQQLISNAAASPANAQDLLMRAARLWSGSMAFADIDNHIVGIAANSLTVQRERAVLQLAALELELGAAVESVELLTPMFESDPTRGDLTQLLAKCLALSHRELDALQVIGRHRGALAEVGASAAAHIDETEAMILRHDHAVIATVPPSPRLSAGLSPVIERPAMVASVLASLRVGPVCLVGEAGVGKSTLAVMVAHVSGIGSSPVFIEAPPAPTRPLQAIHQLLLGLRAARTEDLLARPELADAWQRVAGEQPQGSALVSREELMGALVELLEDSLSDFAQLIVVEDLHHLDPTSGEVLERVLSRSGARLLFTSRTAPVWPGVALTLIDVPPMSPAEVAELAAAVMPIDSTSDVAVDVHRRTGGNALFVRLLLEVMAAADDDLPLPSTLQMALAARLAGLSGTTLAVLNAAALLGATFDVRAVKGVVQEAAEGLDIAVRSRLLTISGHHGKFVHELIAEALVEASPAGQRVSLHDQLCEQLRCCGASPSEIARQAVAAAVLDPGRAAHFALAAAQQYVSVFDWAEVIRWSDLGLYALPSVLPTHPAVIDLLTARGTARRRLGTQGSDGDLLEAARHALKSDDAARLVAAATELCLHGPTSASGFADERAQDVLEQALAADTNEGAKIRLMAAAATLFTMSDQWERGRSLFHQALDVSHQSADRAVRREVLLNSHLGLSHPDDLGRRRLNVRELADYDDADAQWETAFLGFGVALVDGDRIALDTAGTQVRERLGRVAQRGRGSGLLQVESVKAFLAGEFDAAEAFAEEALQVSLVGSSESWALSIYAGLIYPIRDAQGRLAELRPAVAGLLAAQPDFPLWLAVDAAIAARSGDLDRGRAVIARLAAGGFPFIHDLTWSGVAVLAMRTACAVGDVAAATALYALLEPHHSLMSWNGVSTHGPIDAALALAASLRGEPRLAAEHLTIADALIDRMQAPHLRWPELAQIS